MRSARIARPSMPRSIDSWNSSTATPSPDIRAVIELGLNHEQQHQELIVTDIKHALAQNALRPAYRPDAALPSEAAVQPLEWRTLPGGIHWLGHDGAGFAFDNEGPRHRVYLEEFQIASRPVTNGEYLAFMEDGGYSRAELWLSDGWVQSNARGWEAPLYWERVDGDWWTMTLGGFRPVSPVRARLPPELLRSRRLRSLGRMSTADRGRVGDGRARGRGPGHFLESGNLHPRAVDGRYGTCSVLRRRLGMDPEPLHALSGNAARRRVLGEYNAKFMCNQLVLRGGSCATPVSHIRATYRNFFPPEARWQFSGIRLARS